MNPQNEAFECACRIGALDLAKTVYAAGGVEICANRAGFYEACARGHFAVAVWLHSLGGLKVHRKYDAAFVSACLGGHLQVAQWIHSLGNVHPGAIKYQVFPYALTTGLVDIITWLYSLGYRYGHAQENFHDACYRGHLRLAQWIHSTEPAAVDVHANGDAAFQSACFRGRLYVAQWLYSLGDVDISFARERVHPSVVQWLQIVDDQERRWKPRSAWVRVCVCVSRKKGE